MAFILPAALLVIGSLFLIGHAVIDERKVKD